MHNYTRIFLLLSMFMVGQVMFANVNATQVASVAISPLNLGGAADVSQLYTNGRQQLSFYVLLKDSEGKVIPVSDPAYQNLSFTVNAANAPAYTIPLAINTAQYGFLVSTQYNGYAYGFCDALVNGNQQKNPESTGSYQNCRDISAYGTQTVYTPMSIPEEVIPALQKINHFYLSDDATQNTFGNYINQHGQVSGYQLQLTAIYQADQVNIHSVPVYISTAEPPIDAQAKPILLGNNPVPGGFSDFSKAPRNLAYISSLKYFEHAALISTYPVAKFFSSFSLSCSQDKTEYIPPYVYYISNPPTVGFQMMTFVYYNAAYDQDKITKNITISTCSVYATGVDVFGNSFTDRSVPVF